MNINQFEKAYSNLILDSNFIKFELLYHQPNIFSALRLAHHEIRHSNFLGWLLDPNQTHGLGSKFLKLILSDILLDERAKGISITSIGKLDLNNAVVFREWKNIDVLIKLQDLVITIENKVWSSESKHQLEKYKGIINSEFGNSRKVFVFLTPYGLESSMNDEYVNYSYERIVHILQIITATYSQAIPLSVMVYLTDYIQIIKTNFMANGEINNLAREVYLNHKDLFDFILNHTPNPLNELQDYFTKKLGSFGWVKKTSQRNYVRFLPKTLLDIIPNNSKTWKGEAFLFEFLIKTDGIGFYFTIAPGDDETRESLRTALDKFDTNNVDPTEEYICYCWIFKELKDVETFSHDSKSLDKYFEEFWIDVCHTVKVAEDLIIKHKKFNVLNE